MSLSSTASNALALSQETSDNFVHGEKPVIFNSCKESDRGLSPALEFCFTKHESVLSDHFTAKAFLCRLAGHWSRLAGHVLWYLNTNFPL